MSSSLKDEMQNAITRDAVDKAVQRENARYLVLCIKFAYILLEQGLIQAAILYIGFHHK